MLVELELPAIADASAAVEHELRSRAGSDPDGCCGYFPALEGVEGIVSDLPACREFASRVPQIALARGEYGFNFLRLSVARQSAEPAYHLDSDAATAITGDVAAIRHGEIQRLLLNLSPRVQRAVHFLDVDPDSVELLIEGAYIRVSDPDALRRHAVTATIPPRQDARIHGLVFASNQVLHSGVDDEHGHFVAAYGLDIGASGPRSSS